MKPRLTLGPIQYFWDEDRKRDFYARIADEAPVDTVYLGENVCSKRQPFFDQHIEEMAERLQRGGKRVVHSGLAEVMLKRERKSCRDMAEADEMEIEVNNAAGLFHLAPGQTHRVGPYMNVYSEETMAWMATKGATHVTVPTELPGSSVKVMAAKAAELGIGLEVQVFGRACLATSARCYHARAYGRTKDNCQFVCEEHLDGMELNTRDGQAFLRVNGIQTLSHSYVNLFAEAPAMAAMGVTDLRLMPQETDMVEVARIFEAILDGKTDMEAAQARFDALNMQAPLSNGFWHGEAGHRRITAKAASLA
ncbi:ubiquinone anaerobic biosynthesis protein UbiV [Aliiruegeria sabulilitoris]|uniref:ubiquinone anaerobic biosynthesis protein UbiV n=1 Tax=Aliiruegeria sabulilitoris TaxID=1510458 RepID=UPI00082A05D0|nr:U32 family peptidase [Aliiruegeria sabulilitoris]NDR54922.1 U32 family peptidase [Pseudoruegeria sp. M32A2M]